MWRKMKLSAISWGCGVQSTTLAVMGALGDLPCMDVIIMADTGWERVDTYKYLDFYTDWLIARGMRVEILRGNIKRDGVIDHIHVPFWTSSGILRRQCSSEFKVFPVKRRLREMAGYDDTAAPHPQPGEIDLMLGISYDERKRAKQSRVKFMKHHWPLIDMNMSRQDCLRYLNEHSLPPPPKSSCLCCPYRSASEWLHMKKNSPDEWNEIVAFDNAIRNHPLAQREGSTDDQLYIYQGRVPLKDANLAADAARERKHTM